MLCGCFLFVACGGCGLVDIKIVVGVRKNLRMRKKTTLVWLISRGMKMNIRMKMKTTHTGQV